MSDSAFLAGEVLLHATPLILTGLAVAIAFRAGVWNIGADGQFLAGATLAAWIGTAWAPHGVGSWLALPAALAAGAAAGAVWAGIAALLRARSGVLEVISTIMLNFVAAYAVSYLVRGPLQEPTHVYPQTDSIAEHARLPIVLPGTRVHAGVIVAIVAAIVAAWVVRRTAVGFRLRATGANPFAARSAGLIDTERVVTGAFLASGALAGLAGAVEVTGVTYALYENLSPGYGYTAIAVALLARLNPLGTVAAGILFGALEVGASSLQRDVGVPATTAAVAEALIILSVVVAGQWRGSHVRQGT